jgi:hypothetical protein
LAAFFGPAGYAQKRQLPFFALPFLPKKGN